MEKTSTVWILGSGFSRSLGGPLLKDLLSMASWHKLLARDANVDEGDFKQVYALYHFGANFPDGYLFEPSDAENHRGIRAWSNAEEFLELLSDAASEGHDFDEAPRDSGWLERYSKSERQQLLAYVWYHFLRGGAQEDQANSERWRRYWNRDWPPDAPLRPRRLRRAAELLIALECRFLDVKGARGERARPYQEWGRCLSKNDTIISFNYDTLVESIACPGRVRVLLPDFSSETLFSEEVAGDDFPTLIKLHGSVDWTRERSLRGIKREDRSQRPKIAAPGHAKLKLTQGGFKPLWDEASTKLQQADHVVWLGYSMPASDASAVEMILDALSLNRSSELAIDVALGSPSFATDRISSLITGVLQPRKSSAQATAPVLNILPLYAQDYLHRWAICSKRQLSLL